MKVIIVGAGLSGLATAIALKKYIKLPRDEGVEVAIYDRADPHDTGAYGFNDYADIRLKGQGAAISLQPNALRVLRDLDPALADKVRASGYPCTHFTWKTAGNYLLGREYLDLLPISRPTLVQCLAEALPKDVSIKFKTVTRVMPRGASTTRASVQFEDGSIEEADLIVGADGIRSPIRRCLFSADADKGEAKYLGVCAVGGVMEVPVGENFTKDPSVVFNMGPTGVFGYCGLSKAEPNKLLYFSFYDSKKMPDRNEKHDYGALTQHLKERHKGWGDAMIHKCLEKATLDNVYPICYVSDLPYWGRDGCVLVGDAAHAMPPATGQGGSQAFEDAQCLAMLLSGYLAQKPLLEAIAEGIDAFYDLRHGRVDRMKAAGLKLEKQAERPWSPWTTMMIYAGMTVMLQLKYLSSFVWSSNPKVDWNAPEEVRKYLKQKGVATPTT